VTYCVTTTAQTSVSRRTPAAYHHLDLARQAAEKIGGGRDDYGTEFGPVNVAIHAVSVAVDLGDAGHALDLARDIDYQALSPERQARHMIDLASAHAMRRQIGEAIHDLQQAEQLTLELTHAHHGARLVTRDLLQLSGLRPRSELRDLAERFGVLPWPRSTRAPSGAGSSSCIAQLASAGPGNCIR
jgi:hypothetical protein